jgi:single-strand DNA-binding protein
MSSFNKVIMMGNLTRDPEFKQLPSGQGVCRLSLATNRQFKPKNAAEAIQEVCYIDVDVWGAQAESCQNFLKKGSSALIEGRLKLDSWQDNEGQKRSRHSIVADRVTFIKSGSAEDSIEDNYDEPSNNKSNFSAMASGSKKAAGKSEMPRPKASSLSFEDDLPF